MIKKISYERRVYKSVDDNSLSKAISQKTDEKNKSCNKGFYDYNIISREILKWKWSKFWAISSLKSKEQK